jgi:hypothetical protein
LASIELEFFLDGTAGAAQVVYQFNDPSKAQQYYRRTIERAFPQQPNPSTSDPPSFAYHGDEADESLFSCHTPNGAPPMLGCSYVARFGAYVAIFGIHWLADYSLKSEDVQAVPRALDSKMR